jgi:hypothetical protein
MGKPSFEPPDLELGFTSPLYRAKDPFAKDEPKKKRNPIGFVHFGEPEEDYLDEYIQFMLNTDIDDDELHVGFTGDLPF